MACHTTSPFGLQQGRLCKTDLSRLKLSVNIANPCSELLCTEVREGQLNVIRLEYHIWNKWKSESVNACWT